MPKEMPPYRPTQASTNDFSPIWLESNEIQQLLNLLVDRIDASEKRGTKALSVALTLKTWPLLYEAKFESEKETIWGQVIEIAQQGWISIQPLRANRLESGYAYSPRISVLNEAAIRRATHRPERKKSPQELWREAVQEHLIGSYDMKVIASDFCIDIPGRSPADVVHQINKMADLHAGSGQNTLMLREVSAKLFWGLSKVLDKRQALVAALLSLEECPFPESPIQVHVYLPRHGFSGVLFIENLMTFEMAWRSGEAAFNRLAVVYAAGFKGSAQRLRSQDGRSIFYSSQGAIEGSLPSAFESWIDGKFQKDVFFWGDLDHAGMRILLAMKTVFPDIKAWEPGYQPMLDSLMGGEGHDPDSAEKQGQKPVKKTGCDYADTKLLPALSSTGKFVDQEFVRF